MTHRRLPLRARHVARAGWAPHSVPCESLRRQHEHPAYSDRHDAPRLSRGPPVRRRRHVARHRVADPYRWLEDPDDPETEAWSLAQDALLAAESASLPGRDRLASRVAELLGAGTVGTPAWRGDRQFFMRRTAEQEHAVLLTVDPDGTERVLVDPIALDPTGATTLDTWQPSKEGHLLAYQLSEGGTEESVLHVMDVATGDARRGPDRPRALLPRRLAARRRGLLLRPPAARPTWCRTARSSSTAGSGCTGSAPTRTTDAEVFGDGLDMTNYYGVTVSLDGRWLVIGASAGTAPAQRPLARRPVRGGSRGAPSCGSCRPASTPAPSLQVGRDGRVYVFTDRDAPRGRLAVTSPENPAYETWTDLVPEDDEAVLESWAVLDGAGPDGAAAGGGTLLCAWTRHAMSEVSTAPAGHR